MFRTALLLAFSAWSAMAASVQQPAPVLIQLKYGDIIDGSPLTHSGRTLADEMAGIRSAFFSAGLTGRMPGSARKALIEPFLEPYSVLLEDLLEKHDPRQVKPELIELAAHFPPGSPQPAWASLIRTRRYYVLTDGKGYARMFIPGSAAATAYRSQLPALRHVIDYVLKAQQAAGPLTLDVYAYENELATQTLKLKLPRARMVMSQAPTPASTLVPVNLGALNAFLEQGTTLEGAALDANGQLVLLGTKRASPMTFEGQPVTLADLAVAYRAIFYAGEGKAYISLDPSPYPEQAQVNFGGHLEDTRMGWVTLRSDMRFKTLSVGYDPESGDKVEDQTRKQIPGFVARVMRLLSSPSSNGLKAESTRFWFYPDNIIVQKSADEQRMSIVSPRYTAGGERQTEDGADDTANTPSWTRESIAHLNRNYDQYAAIFPEFQELDSVGRLLALFTWLKQKQDDGRLAIDLDPLLNVPLPLCRTPRRTPQLLTAFFAPTAGGQILSIGLGDITERFMAARERSRSFRERFAAERAEVGSDGAVLTNYAIYYGAARILRERPGIAASERELIEKYKGLGTLSGGIIVAPNAGRTLRPGLPESTDTFLQGMVRSGGQPVARGTEQWLRSPQAGKWDGTFAVRRLDLRPIEMEAGMRILRGESAVVTTAVGPDGKVAWLRAAPANTWESNGARSVNFDATGRVSHAVRVEGAHRLTYRLDGGGTVYSAARFESRMAPDEVHLGAVDRALAAGKSTGETWARIPADVRMGAFDRTGDRTAVLYHQGEEPVFRMYRGGTLEREARGPAAVREMEAIGRVRVQQASTGELKFVFASGLQEKEVVLQVGTKSARVPVEEMERLIGSPRERNALKIDELFKDGGEVVIYRDALDRRPVLNGGSLREGTATDPVRIASALQERYRNARVYLDDEPDIAIKNRARLAGITGPKDIVAMVPEESFAVEDRGALSLIKGSLKSAGIKLANTGSELGTIPNVLMINGHNDAQLVRYLTDLGEHGFLENRVLLLNTCYAKSNPNYFSEMLARYKPTAIFMHSEQVHVDALQRMVRELGPMLKTAEELGAPIEPADLVKKSVERALKDPDLSPKVRVHLEKLTRGVLQISRNITTRKEATIG